MVVIYYIIVFVFGLCVGSFLNVVIERTLRDESIVFRASHCLMCDKKIKWYDLCPLISYLFLRCKCRQCGAKISLQYPLVELFTGLFAMLCVYGYLGSFSTLLNNEVFWLLNFFICCVLVVIFTSDIRYYLILDEVMIPGIFFVFFVKLWLGYENNILLHELKYLLVSGAIGFLFFGVQYWLSSGKWIGGGDMRLGAFMGVALGWQKLLAALAIGYIIGAIVAVILLLKKQTSWKSKLPLGVFLSSSSIIALFWGEKIIEWYLTILK
ncbi:MAG: prepilin peptidase [Candidatus Falkowbacteria bacterium]